MIRIGFVRWFVKVSLEPIGGGRSKLSLQMEPQAKRYKTLQRVWAGIHDSMQEIPVEVSPQEVSTIDDSYLMMGQRLISQARILAKELASKAVNYCSNVGIIDSDGYDKGAGIYIVETSLMNAISAGVSDPDVESEPEIDLIPDMREVREERERLAAQRWEQHNADTLAARQFRSQATKTSMELLYGMLSKSEAEEARTTGKVTIRISAGDFVVPVTAHGLVKQYVDKKYKVSYCVVFEDYSLPVGDEALMKIALLKTDPARFIRKANKFVER